MIIRTSGHDGCSLLWRHLHYCRSESSVRRSPNRWRCGLFQAEQYRYQRQQYEQTAAEMTARHAVPQVTMAGTGVMFRGCLA